MTIEGDWIARPETADPTGEVGAHAAMLQSKAPGSVCLPLGRDDNAVLLAHRHAPAHEFFNPGSPCLQILAVPFFQCTEALLDLGDGWRDHFCPAPQPLYVLPADTAYRWRVNGTAMTVTLAIPIDTVERLFDELDLPGATARLVPLLGRGFVDPLVYESVMRLWALARFGGACPALLLQSHLACMLHALGVRATAGSTVPARTAGLSRLQLGAVLALMDERIADALTLDELADACRLSRFHFVRQFRQATGHSPYHYLQCRRVERARALLTSTRLPVAHIGSAVGFPEPSHFSRTFARHVGMSPLHYRMQRA